MKMITPLLALVAISSEVKAEFAQENAALDRIVEGAVVGARAFLQTKEAQKHLLAYRSVEISFDLPARAGGERPTRGEIEQAIEQAMKNAGWEVRDSAVSRKNTFSLILSVPEVIL